MNIKTSTCIPRTTVETRYTSRWCPPSCSKRFPRLLETLSSLCILGVHLEVTSASPPYCRAIRKAMCPRIMSRHASRVYRTITSQKYRQHHSTSTPLNIHNNKNNHHNRETTLRGVASLRSMFLPFSSRLTVSNEGTFSNTEGNSPSPQFGRNTTIHTNT